MFFVSSKIIWAFLAPINLIFLLMALAFLMMKRREKTSKFLMRSALIIFVIFGILPTGHNMLYRLEKSSTRPAPMPDHIAGAIVLGGATETLASDISGMTEFNDGVERVLSGIALARAYPGAKVIFSGGSGHLVNIKRKEAADVSSFLKTIGFEGDNIVYEDQSRNTYENIRNSKEIAKPVSGETWLLVTSAFHMPRSLGIAEKLGWDVVPYPVDYRSRGRYLLWPDGFDCLDYLYAADLSIREMIGMMAYKLTGKI